MTYFPYFRGKQYELITVRECAGVFRNSGFTPVIEPVKSQLNGLSKTIDAVIEEGGTVIVVANPKIGDLSDNNDRLIELLNAKYEEDKLVTVAIILDESTTFGEATALCNQFEGKNLALLHSGFSQARALAEAVRNNDHLTCSIFEDRKSGKLYQNHFAFHTERVLLKDGFKKRRNRDHPDVEIFSDLHITFPMEGMTGFADYLIVGDDYQESGGPAYTIAIHLTFINDDDDNIMYVRHFKSIRQDTPTDPAGKFAEALKQLIEHIASPQNKFYETSAIAEFRELHEKGHYPGLGYVKKLSMKHHIETFAQYFKTNPA